MLPRTALLCVGMILKRVSTLPTDASPLTSTATLTMRDTQVQPTGGLVGCGYAGGCIVDPPLLPEAVDFVDHCKYDVSGHILKSQSMGGRVVGYIVGTCQTVDPGSSLMSINWKDPGFGNLTFYKDQKCKDEMAATTRPRYGWHDGSCFDLSKLPKMLSFKGEKSEGKKKREILSSAATLSMRDTVWQEPGGAYDCGGYGVCSNPDPPPLPEAVNFYDHCPYEPNGNLLEAKKTGGNVTGYIVGTCQKIDFPGPTMSVNYKDGKFDRMVVYHDKDCKDRITAYDRGKTTWKDYGCIDLSKLKKVLSFKGVIMQKSR